MDELSVRILLEKTSFPYLAAYPNEWIDADGKRKTFDEMGKNYLKNCYIMLQKQKYNVEHGYCLQGVKYNKTQYKEICEIIKKLYNDKVSEIENYLK